MDYSFSFSFSFINSKMRNALRTNKKLRGTYFLAKAFAHEFGSLWIDVCVWIQCWSIWMVVLSLARTIGLSKSLIEVGDLEQLDTWTIHKASDSTFLLVDRCVTHPPQNPYFSLGTNGCFNYLSRNHKKQVVLPNCGFSFGEKNSITLNKFTIEKNSITN